MFQALSRTCLDSRLINKQVDDYMCVCYHQNLKLHKGWLNRNQPLIFFDPEIEATTWKQSGLRKGEQQVAMVERDPGVL